MPLTTQITKGDAGGYKVKLTGSLDSDTSGEFDRRMIEVWADPKARTIRLDLSDLTFISSLGLGSLAKVKKGIQDRGGAMVTVGAQPQIAKVFSVVKMLPKETIFVSHKEADEYLAAIQKNVLEGGA